MADTSQNRRSARAKLERAQEDIVAACKLLRDDGLPENADELMKEARRLRVWTQRDGWLDILDRQLVDQKQGRVA